MLISNPAVFPVVLNLNATYPGDVNYNGSVSANQPHTVDVVSIAAILLGDGVEGRVVGTGTSGLAGVRFPITGGSAPYTCSDPGATLPAGITVVIAVTGTDCELQGAPAGGSAGAYMVDITVTDASLSADTTGPMAWDINVPLAITDPAGLADAVEDRNYAFTFDSTMLGGNGPYTWGEMGASLGAAGCAGFAINAGGDLTGTQPLVAGGGTCNFTAQVTDTASTTTMVGTDTQAEIITVQPMLTITTTNLANAKRGDVYLPSSGLPGDVIQSAGGTGTPVTYSVTAGPFALAAGVWTGSGACAGLMFNETGATVVSGADLDTVVNGTATTAGTCSFTVSVNDNGSGAAGPDPTPPSQAFSIIILDTFAYVANNGNNTLGVINTGTNVFVQSIVLAGAPSEVAISPDGRFVFASLTAAEQIEVVDASTNTKLTNSPFSIGASCDQPFGLAVAELGSSQVRLSVACSGTDAATGERIVTLDFDPATGGSLTGADTADVDLGAGTTESPMRLAVTTDGTTVFASIHRGAATNGRWARVNTTTGALIDATDFGVAAADDCDEPLGVAITQTAFAGNPEEAYFACDGQEQVAIVTVSTNVQPATNIALTGTGVNSIAFNPAGTRAYVTMDNTDEVEVIDTAARTAANFNLPNPAAATANVTPIGITIPVAGAIEVFIALNTTVAGSAPGVAILNDAASPTAGTNNTINPASAPAYPAGSSPQGIAAIPTPR
jgi:YVTN family beta-propeller protein